MSVDYESIYKNLSSQVSDITERSKVISYFEAPKINKKDIIVGGVLLIIISIILFVSKPSFIMDVKFGTKNRVINYSKFLVALIVILAILLAIYMYYIRKYVINFF